MRTTTGRASRCEDLGQHAAATDRAAGAARHRLEVRIARLRFGDERGVRIASRVARIESGLIGEDDEHVGLDQVGDQRTERVVVAELDLVGDHGVVLVDHRYHAHRQQREERGARVEIAAAIGEVGVCEQDLRGADPVLREAALVRLRETHLSHRRGGLQLVHRDGPLGPAESLDPFGDRARRDQHDFLLQRAQCGELRGPARDRVAIEAATIVGDERAADLDDDAPGGAEDAHDAVLMTRSADPRDRPSIRPCRRRCRWIASVCARR